MTSLNSGPAAPYGVRRVTEPAVWVEIVDARRAELAARGPFSREQRRADERNAWLRDLYDRFAVVGVSVGASHDPDADLLADDPRAALVKLAAAAIAWVDAMDQRPGPVPRG